MLVVMADRALTSVGDLFMGAVFPSLLLGLSYVVYLVIYGKLWPDRAPLASTATADENAIPLRQIITNVALDVLPALMLIVSVLGSIVGGVATPTQAAAIGAGAATLLAFAGPLRGGIIITAVIACTLLFQMWVAFGRTDTIAVPSAARISYLAALTGCLIWTGLWCRQKLTNEWRTIIQTGLETARTCGYIFAIFIGAAMFSFILKKIRWRCPDPCWHRRISAIGWRLPSHRHRSFRYFLVGFRARLDRNHHHHFATHCPCYRPDGPGHRWH